MCRHVQNAKPAGDLEPFVQGSASASAFIDQDVRPNKDRKSDRRALAGIEGASSASSVSTTGKVSAHTGRSGRSAPDSESDWYPQQPEASEAESMQTGAFPLHVFHPVLDPDFVGFQEAIDLIAGFETE